MAVITTGLTYTLSGQTLPLHPDPTTITQWCVDNSLTYDSFQTETYANHVPGKAHKMYATYEAEIRTGYDPAYTGVTGSIWGFRWAAINEVLVSVTTT